MTWFFLAIHNSLLQHSNQWDCFILYRQQITSNGFFSCLPKWAKAGFRVIEKDFEIKSWSCMFFLLYKTNRFHVAVRLFSNRSQRTSKCGKNISGTLSYRHVCHFVVLTTSWRHLWSRDHQETTSFSLAVIYYWTDARQREIYLLIFFVNGMVFLKKYYICILFSTPCKYWSSPFKITQTSYV